jgi:ABC-type multidrug transport system fused ATPase/permease subunit
MKEKKYSTFDNLKYIFKNWISFDKGSFFLVFFRVPTLIVLPVITALIPKMMIDAINDGVSAGAMLGVVGLMSALFAGITWLDPFLQSKTNAVAENLNTDFRIRAFRRMMNADYEYVESLEGRLAFEKSKGFTNAWGAGARGFFDFIVKFTSNALGIFTYIAILSAVDPLLIVTIVIAGAGNYAAAYFHKKATQKIYDGYKINHMRTGYLLGTANDVSSGKDIRIFGFKRLFGRVIDDVRRDINKKAKKVVTADALLTVAAGLLTAACQAAAFFYLIGGVLRDELSVSDFVFYFALVTGFLTWIFFLTRNIFQFKNISFNCARYRQFVEGGDAPAKDGKGESPFSAADFPCEIEFKDVTFKYNDADEPTIRGVSFKVIRGEKIAVVGENGAGKTTCIKLLCGFYKPTSGVILINGRDASDIDRRQYFKLFSAVFQDYILLPMSILQNVSLTVNPSDGDKERAALALAAAGLKEKIDRLKDGAETRLIKKVFDDAVSLSGGETQKLLLARALYKDAPILILDEPTAALDPIAENEIYLKYNDYTRGKTSFFISHRLSSTRFCDRIFFVKDGKIAEAGTHGELLARGGEYKKMYDIQSYYYKHENAKSQDANNQSAS